MVEAQVFRQTPWCGVSDQAEVVQSQAGLAIPAKAFPRNSLCLLLWVPLPSHCSALLALAEAECGAGRGGAGAAAPAAAGGHRELPTAGLSLLERHALAQPHVRGCLGPVCLSVCPAALQGAGEGKEGKAATSGCSLMELLGWWG